jgi:hypothetical protein
LKQLQQVLVESILVQKHAGLFHHVQLPQRKDLHDFLERPETTRQSHECVCPRFHQQLPLPHRHNRDEFVCLVIGQLASFHELWNYSNDAAASHLDRTRNRAHQARFSTAVNQSPTSLDHLRPKRLGRRKIFPIDSIARRAIDTK